MINRGNFIRLALGATVAALPFTPAVAADQKQDAQPIEEVVVTGTRVADRSATDTAVPVDVVASDALTDTGNTEVNQALSKALPSFNFPRPSLNDGTDTIRPATLRGLAPDQTLVLVNSKRRHASSLVNVNGSIGRGAAAVDLNTDHAVSTTHLGIKPEQLDDPRYAEAWPLARATELLKITKFLPNNPQFGDLNGIIYTAMQGVETGRLSAEDAADFVIDEAESSLDDVMVK